MIGRKARWRTVAALLVFGILLAVGFAMASAKRAPVTQPSGARSSGHEFVRTRKGHLSRSLLVTGELSAVNAVRITVPRFRDRASVPIQAMAPEGSVVRRGDLLLQIDNANLINARNTDQINLEKAENDLIKKEAEEEIRIKDLEREVETRRLESAKAALKAEIPKEYLPTWEWQDNQFAHDKARKEHEKTSTALASARKAAAEELALLRIKRDVIKAKIAAIEGDLQSMRIVADRTGTVLYENAPLTWNSGEAQRKFQVGDQVWPGMVIMSVPDLREMDARIFVSEVDGALMRPGQQVRLTADSHPQKTFTGVVDYMPDVAEQMRKLSNVRAFVGRVKLDSTDPAVMKPGMSVRAEILVGEQAGTIVPRSAISWNGGKPYITSASGLKTETRILARNPTECLIPDLAISEELLVAGTR